MKALVLKQTVSLFLVLFLNSSFAEDFNVDGVFTQSVQVNNIELLQLHCYCSNNIDIVRDNAEAIVLEIEANFSSLGYHGTQRIPDSIPESLLKFEANSSGSLLILSSHEYTVIHHAMIIKSLKIHVPSGIRFQLIPIEYNQLEGRKNA